MLRVAVARTFAASLEQPLRRHLSVPCEIVGEAALYDALARRAIAGAALDVWYRYPAEPGPAAPASLPFHQLSNVLMTPHVSGWTEGMLEARARLIAENIARVARGVPPRNRVA